MEAKLRFGEEVRTRVMSEIGVDVSEGEVREVDLAVWGWMEASRLWMGVDAERERVQEWDVGPSMRVMRTGT